MDAMLMLQEMGDVPPADAAVIEAAVEVVRAAAFQEQTHTALEAPTTRPPRRRRWALEAAGLVTAAAAVLGVVVLLPQGGGTGPPTVRPRGESPLHHPPKALTA